jgi:hypothetical protein
MTIAGKECSAVAAVVSKLSEFIHEYEALLWSGPVMSSQSRVSASIEQAGGIHNRWVI